MARSAVAQRVAIVALLVALFVAFGGWITHSVATDQTLDFNVYYLAAVWDCLNAAAMILGVLLLGRVLGGGWSASRSGGCSSWCRSGDPRDASA